MKSMRILVTGGAGFIGSHVTRRMLERGHQVVVADNLSTGFRQNVPVGAEFFLADLTRREEIERLPSNLDAVIHFAAQTSGEISFDDPARDLAANTMATLLLLEFCRRRSIGRFLFASSLSVYGESRYLPMDEDHLTAPLSFYGASKLAAEQYIRIFQQQGLRTTVFRLFHVYGPGQNLENLRQGMVSIYLAYILDKKPVLVKGSLDRFRDFNYVDDVVDVFDLALENERTVGAVLNLGSGVKTTVRELIDTQLKAFGYDPKTYPIEVVNGTPGDTVGIQADIRKCERLLGPLKRHTLEAGIGKMTAWARSLKP